jgi:hypothetical protein
MATVNQELAALRAQVTELAELVREVVARDFTMEHFWQAGHAHGEETARQALYGRAARTSREPRSTGLRTNHLRSVDNDAG